jgi:hypothetical protein
VSLALGAISLSARSTHHGATHTPSFDGEETRRRSYARFVCVCGTKRSPARTSAVRTCMRGKYVGAGRPPPLRALPQDRSQRPGGGGGQALLLLAPLRALPQNRSQRPGGGGGQALLLLALGVAGGHGGQAGCLQPLQRVRRAAQLRVALLGREGRCAESPAMRREQSRVSTRHVSGWGGRVRRAGLCQSCMATPNSARRARVGHSACVVRALAMGPATQAARMHSGRESPGKKA